MARILAAARECFARTGYAATTNKQIADAAGCTAAALYLYFDSKTALYVATVRSAYAELLPHYRAAVDGATTLRGGLCALLRASTPVAERDPSLAAFLSCLAIEMQRHPELGPAMSQETTAVLGVFEQLVRLGVQTGEVPPADAPRVLSMFIACTIGLSIFAASIDASQFGSVVDAFSALIEGRLLGSPRAAPKKKRKR